MWILRTAVLLFYMRIFSSIRWIYITSLAVIILSGAFYAASIFINVDYCAPRAGKSWDTVSFARCSDPFVRKYDHEF
jgi:hypothetical protein